MKRYFGLLDGEPGAYGVAFPDCPGCVAMGADTDEAYANAVDALAEWMRDAGAAGAPPEPRTMEALRRDPEVQTALAEGSIFIVMPLVIDCDRLVKADISLDPELLDAIDAAAKRGGLTRSAFLASAAREKIEASG